LSIAVSLRLIRKRNVDDDDDSIGDLVLADDGKSQVEYRSRRTGEDSRCEASNPKDGWLVNVE
jgi:hypothetical protein